MEVAGTTAVVTGASSGIGAATASRLAEAGSRVVLVARTVEALERVAQHVRATGGIADVIPADLSDPDAVDRVAAEVVERAGTPDIVVNNAGAGRWLHVLETDPDELLSMTAVPYFAGRREEPRTARRRQAGPSNRCRTASERSPPRRTGGADPWPPGQRPIARRHPPTATTQHARGLIEPGQSQASNAVDRGYARRPTPVARRVSGGRCNTRGGRLVPVPATVTPAPAPPSAPNLERRGRRWLLWSFLLCPCHLPLTLAVLGTVLAGTSMGALLRDHAWVAGTIISLTWTAGTGYGFHLIRRAQRSAGACPLPSRGPVPSS